MKHKTPPDYEQKFANFIKLCTTAFETKNLIIAEPWVLGDTYDEVMESLSRIADANLVLHIVQSGRSK
jgi:hypothetical protein